MIAQRSERRADGRQGRRARRRVRHAAAAGDDSGHDRPDAKGSEAGRCDRPVECRSASGRAGDQQAFRQHDGDEPDPKAPRVDADITTRSLLVRGTAGQVEQIRDLLRKLGETEDEGGGSSSKQTARAAAAAIGLGRSVGDSQIEQIWPSVRPNRIRIVTPTAAIPSYRPGDSTGAGAVPNAGRGQVPRRQRIAG